MRSDGADMTDVLRQDDVRPCIDQGLPVQLIQLLTRRRLCPDLAVNGGAVHDGGIDGRLHYDRACRTVSG